MVGSSFGYRFGIPCWGDSISLELICNGKRMFAVHLVPQWDVSSLQLLWALKGLFVSRLLIRRFGWLLLPFVVRARSEDMHQAIQHQRGNKKHGSVSHSNLPLRMAQGYSCCLYTQGNRTKEFNGRGEINSHSLCWVKLTYCFETCAFTPHPKSPGKWLCEWGKWIKGSCRKAYLNHEDCRGKVSAVKMESDTEQAPLGSVLGPCLLKPVK